MERIIKILESDNSSVELIKLHENKELEKIIPELSALDIKSNTHKNIFYHTMKVLDRVEAINGSLNMKITAILHDIGKIKTHKFIGNESTFHNHEEVGAKLSKNILLRMNLSNESIEYITRMIHFHGRLKILTDVTDSAIRRLDKEVGVIVFDLIEFCKCDNSTSKPEKLKRICDGYDLIKKRIIEVREYDKIQAWRSPLTGEIIMQVLNIPASKLVGDIKSEYEQRFRDGVITIEDAIEEIKDRYLKK